MKLQATVQLTGKNTTGIEVSPGLVEKLGAGKRPPVGVTINGYTYRTSIGVMGGRHLISVSSDVRKAAGIAAGDQVEVDFQVDAAPRELDIPADLASELDAGTRRFFDGLSYSRKQRFVLPIEQARTPETRKRRIDKAVTALRAGKTEP